MKQYTFLLILLVTGASFATTWTVDDDGKADFSDIQSAINAASDGDEIIIMPGTYTGAGDQVVDTLGKAITLRGQSVDSTIINGENLRRGITCRSTSQSNVVIENLWIQNCLAENGGGLWMEGNPEVKTCWIMNNNAISAGGNVYVLSGNPIFSAGCNFNNGTAPYGAGVYCKDGSPEFDSCFFLSNNASERGGAIRGYQISGYFSNCSFSNNTAARGGAGHFQANLNGLSSTFDTCYFQNNTASSLGGGVVNNSTTDSLFQSCSFVNNTSTGLNGGQGSGGGMFNDSSNPHLLSCIFDSNTANSNGGGIYNWSSTPQVQDCQFLNNSAATGGGIRSTNGTGPSITSSTFCENIPDNVSGVHVDDGTNCLADSCADYDNDGTPDECQFSDVWTVDDDGLDYPGADFISIQDAIDAASDGEEILVFPGTYSDGSPTSGLSVVNMLGKEVWLHSSEGAEVTIIDGMYDEPSTSWRGIYCANGETSNTIIEGFTITNCYSSVGGGMACSSNPTLISCAFTGNTALFLGGGMLNTDGSPTLTNCTFTDNMANFHSGGGIYNQNSSPTLDGCTFTNNTATYYGGGMYNISSNPTLISCAFTGNTASLGNGIFNTSGASTHFFGANASDDELYIQDASSLAFSAESTCDVTGSTVLSSAGTIIFDIDAINTSSSLNVSESIDLLGGLVVSNNSSSLLAANVGDIIPLAQASTLVGNFDSIVFPLMPEGLGLQLIDYPALRGGGSEVAAEVIEVEGANFSNPFSGGLDSPPVDITSFDADGDGADEIAVLFGGNPGGIAVYALSEDGAPSLIDGYSAEVGSNPVDLDAGDLDGDGLEDLLVANNTSETITVLITTLASDGTLTFIDSTINTSGKPTSLAIIDWNDDADLDAAIGIDITDPVATDGYQVLLDVAASNSNGPWFAIPDYQLPDDTYVPDPPTCVDGGDQNSAWGFVGGTRYGRIHRGTSGGSLQVIDELQGNNTITIEAIELDEGGGDGQIDLMVSSDEAESIYLFKGNAAESDGFDNLIPLGVSSSVENFVVLDADGDDDMDIVMTAPTSDTPLVLLRNDGGGTGLVGGLNGITWSKQAMDSDNPPKNIAGGTLGGKDEDDDWVVGAGVGVGLRGKETGTMEQTNILFGTSCPADLDGNGIVAIADLLVVIAAWDTNDPLADLSGNGIVDIPDVLALVAAWGPCE